MFFSAYALSICRRCPPLRFADLLGGAGVGLENARADVAGLVDAVAKAHDPFLARQGVTDPLLGAVRPAGRHQNVHHLLVGAAVERALERADGAGNTRVHVAERRDDNAGGEGRGVELVLGVEDERDIEGLHFLGSGFGLAEHVEEVRGLAEVLARQDWEEPLGEAVVVGDGDGDLREEPLGLAEIGVVGVVGGVLVEMAEGGDGGRKASRAWSTWAVRREVAAAAAGGGLRRRRWKALNCVEVGLCRGGEVRRLRSKAVLGGSPTL